MGLNTQITRVIQQALKRAGCLDVFTGRKLEDRMRKAVIIVEGGYVTGIYTSNSLSLEDMCFTVYDLDKAFGREDRREEANAVCQGMAKHEFDTK
jgi:hypothetical protein